MPRDERAPYTESAEAPYWQRHYGIGHQWMPSERGRRGCAFLLYGAALVIAVTLLIGAVMLVMR